MTKDDLNIGKGQPFKAKKMRRGDLVDLIEIALTLAMRLGYPETASHLYRAFDSLEITEEDRQWF